MQFCDRLSICLLALQSRHPNSVITFSAGKTRCQELDEGVWTVEAALDKLQTCNPELLQETALLIDSAQKCELHLGEEIQESPLCTFHCHGRIPTHTKSGSEVVAPSAIGGPSEAGDGVSQY